jgi:undecaprenyl-diphosphatase
VDWRVYQEIYGVSLHHHWVGSLFSGIEAASIPFMVIVTVSLWLFARPGGNRKWKIASAAALGSAALALALNRAIASLVWHRDRPYLDHRIAHPWSNAHDASFPSDHASASFAIAFAVLLIDPLVGALFLLAAAVIAIGRLFIGAHYPGDVAAGFLVGLVSAVIVVKLLRPVVAALVRLVERATDPILARIWSWAKS